MKYFYELDKIIPYITCKDEGKYNGFSYVLVGGSSYKPSYFNKFNVPKNDNFYRKFNYEVEYPNINFQKMLSKKTKTFSFDRPTDLLNHNLYNNDKYNFYIASKGDLTIKKYGKFIKNLLDYHKIKPPYVFIGFSEGCYDTMTFAKYYPKLTKKIFWIDGGLIGDSLIKYEKFRKNHIWFDNLLKDKFWKFNKNSINKKDKYLLEKIDLFNYNIKTYQFLKNDDLLKIDKNIPIIICWSKYHPVGNKLIAKPKYVIKIKKDYCNILMKKYNLNIKCVWFDAPHHIERVFPITLSKFIIKNT